MLDHHYDGLEGDWAEYAKVALKFVKARYASIPPEDMEDMVQRIILAMDKVGKKMGREPGGWMWKVAHYELLHYWRERAKSPLLSLNYKQDPDNPKSRELWETLAAPDTDLEGQLDTKLGLKACWPGIQIIGRKLEKGDPLTPKQASYLARFREDGQSSSPHRNSERYHQRRSLGLCVRCGAKAEEDRSYCAQHLAIHRRSQASYKRRKGKTWEARLRAHWRREGRCPRCGRPPQTGRKKCPQCLALNRNHLRRWRETDALARLIAAVLAEASDEGISRRALDKAIKITKAQLECSPPPS